MDLGEDQIWLFIFTKSIINNEPITVFNNGQMIRDFTYIDDIVESLKRILNKPAIPDNSFDQKIQIHQQVGRPIRF